jgi:carboxylate-amine ligase
VTDARFGASPPFSLGVEEELMIVDASSFDQVPAVARLLERASTPGLKTELFASIVESNTEPLAGADEVEAALRALRRTAAEAAQAEGLAVAAAGTHPFADPELQAIVDEKRYTSFAGYGGVTVRRQGVQGLHVHVGMPSAEACWRCLELVLPWLPVVLALSANSPWFRGERTGMASNRAPVLGELPRAGPPPAFASYEEWEEWLARLVRLGVAQDHTRLWWDVRPHPTFGTLEVRVPDQPTDVGLSAAFAALLQGLCSAALSGALPERSGLLADHGRADYAQNRWAAARFGPRAELLHPDGHSVASAAELGAELIALVAPAARELNGDALLARIDPQMCEADLQLRFASAQDAAADLVVRSLG